MHLIFRRRAIDDNGKQIWIVLVEAQTLRIPLIRGYVAQVVGPRPSGRRNQGSRTSGKALEAASWDRLGSGGPCPAGTGHAPQAHRDRQRSCGKAISPDASREAPRPSQTIEDRAAGLARAGRGRAAQG